MFVSTILGFGKAEDQGRKVFTHTVSPPPNCKVRDCGGSRGALLEWGIKQLCHIIHHPLGQMSR